MSDLEAILAAAFAAWGAGMLAMVLLDWPNRRHRP